MAVGAGSTITLYDANGNPVTLALDSEGRYRLGVEDESLRALLADVRDTLKRIESLHCDLNRYLIPGNQSNPGG